MTFPRSAIELFCWPPRVGHNQMAVLPWQARNSDTERLLVPDKLLATRTLILAEST